MKRGSLAYAVPLSASDSVLFAVTPLPKAAEADATARVPMPTATAPGPVASGAAPEGGPQTGQFSPT